MIAGTHCQGGSLQFRLRLNDQAYVSSATPNNVRSQPNTGSEIVSQIPAGAPFTVTAGPQCSNGLAWWQINYSGLTGWTAEGTDDEYWLGPGCVPEGCAAG